MNPVERGQVPIIQVPIIDVAKYEKFISKSLTAGINESDNLGVKISKVFNNLGHKITTTFHQIQHRFESGKWVNDEKAMKDLNKKFGELTKKIDQPSLKTTAAERYEEITDILTGVQQMKAVCALLKSSGADVESMAATLENLDARIDNIARSLSKEVGKEREKNRVGVEKFVNKSLNKRVTTEPPRKDFAIVSPLKDHTVDRKAQFLEERTAKRKLEADQGFDSFMTGVEQYKGPNKADRVKLSPEQVTHRDILRLGKALTSLIGVAKEAGVSKNIEMKLENLMEKELNARRTEKIFDTLEEGLVKLGAAIYNEDGSGIEVKGGAKYSELKNAYAEAIKAYSKLPGPDSEDEVEKRVLKGTDKTGPREGKAVEQKAEFIKTPPTNKRQANYAKYKEGVAAKKEAAEEDRRIEEERVKIAKKESDEKIARKQAKLDAKKPMENELKGIAEQGVVSKALAEKGKQIQLVDAAIKQLISIIDAAYEDKDFGVVMQPAIGDVSRYTPELDKLRDSLKNFKPSPIRPFNKRGMTQLSIRVVDLIQQEYDKLGVKMPKELVAKFNGIGRIISRIKEPEVLVPSKNARVPAPERETLSARMKREKEDDLSMRAISGRGDVARVLRTGEVGKAVEVKHAVGRGGEQRILKDKMKKIIGDASSRIKRFGEEEVLAFPGGYDKTDEYNNILERLENPGVLSREDFSGLIFEVGNFIESEFNQHGSSMPFDIAIELHALGDDIAKVKSEKVVESFPEEISHRKEVLQKLNVAIDNFIQDAEGIVLSGSSEETGLSSLSERDHSKLEGWLDEKPVTVRDGIARAEKILKLLEEDLISKKVGIRTNDGGFDILKESRFDPIKGSYVTLRDMIKKRKTNK